MAHVMWAELGVRALETASAKLIQEKHAHFSSF